MKEKVLLLASVASMIDQFNMPNIELLQSLDYEVHVACNFEDGNTCSNEKIIQLKNKLSYLNVPIYQINFSRSVFNIRQNYIAYKCVKRIMLDNNYKFIHCHSPIGGVIGRLACKITKTKCIYTAHGFHFYKGASLKNWILFYPIEKLLSKYTDILITINKEDYMLAKKKFKARYIEYIPGIGIDLSRFVLIDFNRNEYRKSLNLKENDFMILSVGELNKNKNHEIVINALSKIKNENIHYFIAGKGILDKKLIDIAKNQKLEKNIHLIGFRDDVAKLYKCADLFIHPSIREGLPVALMEALSCGCLSIGSNIRGNRDLLPNSNMYSNLNELVNLIVGYRILDKKSYNTNLFCVDHISKLMFEVYSRMEKFQ